MLKPVTLPSLSNQELMFLIVPEFYGPNTVFLEDLIQPLRHKPPFPILSLPSTPDSFQHIVPPFLPPLHLTLSTFPAFYLPIPFLFPSFPFLSFPSFPLPFLSPSTSFLCGIPLPKECHYLSAKIKVAPFVS